MERAYFLGILFRLPIDKGQDHLPVRLAEATHSREARSSTAAWISGPPEGTDVHAARDGTVEEVGTNEVLGNYVVVTHPGGYQTVYGHLSSISVTMRRR